MGDVGKLVVISGPSGAGKTSVCKALKQHPRVAFSVSATTRRPRKGEVSGVDYLFLTEDEFDRHRLNGEFLEWAEYNGHRYGTLSKPMREALAEGKVFVLEIEVQGTRKLRCEGIVGDYIFIVPPSLDVLRQRLEARGTNTPEEIEERLRIAAEELRARELYDAVIENDVLEGTIAKVMTRIGL
ncbi:MAG: guanylate kinase [Planctomycetes bacterium]|nr:guanylate kinase [Planctomycetota bacterium]MCB9872100.1 guanylate kinase [Planctomycetota bacterium]